MRKPATVFVFFAATTGAGIVTARFIHEAMFALKVLGVATALAVVQALKDAQAAQSELFGQACLFQHRVGGMPEFDFTVHGKMNFCDRIKPDFMFFLVLIFQNGSLHANGLYQNGGKTTQTAPRCHSDKH